MRSLPVALGLAGLWTGVAGNAMTAYVSRFTQEGCPDHWTGGHPDYAIEAWLHTDNEPHEVYSGCLYEVTPKRDNHGSWAYIGPLMDAKKLFIRVDGHEDDGSGSHECHCNTGDDCCMDKTCSWDVNPGDAWTKWCGDNNHKAYVTMDYTNAKPPGEQVKAYMTRYKQSGCTEWGDQEYALEVWISTNADGYSDKASTGCLYEKTESLDHRGNWAMKIAYGATRLRVKMHAHESDSGDGECACHGSDDCCLDKTCDFNLPKSGSGTVQCGQGDFMTWIHYETTTSAPTAYPTLSPRTSSPSANPSTTPSRHPTLPPTKNPTEHPTVSPTKGPSATPVGPTYEPTSSPNHPPTIRPTIRPSVDPSRSPTVSPSSSPTGHPSQHPSVSPTAGPVISSCTAAISGRACAELGCAWSKTLGCILCTRVGKYACGELGCATNHITHKCMSCTDDPIECKSSAGCYTSPVSGTCTSHFICEAFGDDRDKCIENGCGWEPTGVSGPGTQTCALCSLSTTAQLCRRSGCGWDTATNKCNACPDQPVGGDCTKHTGCKEAAGLCVADYLVSAAPSAAPTTGAPSMSPLPGQTPNPTVSPTLQPTTPPTGSPQVSHCTGQVNPSKCAALGCAWSTTLGCLDCAGVGKYACTDLGCAETIAHDKCLSCDGNIECRISSGCAVLTDGTCTSRFACKARGTRESCSEVGCGWTGTECVDCTTLTDSGTCRGAGCGFTAANACGGCEGLSPADCTAHVGCVDKGGACKAGEATLAPTVGPSSTPSLSPSANPSASPSASPSLPPTGGPSTSEPSTPPSTPPSTSPQVAPSLSPSMAPSTSPSVSICTPAKTAAECGELGCAWTGDPGHGCVNCGSLQKFACGVMGCKKSSTGADTCESCISNATTVDNSIDCTSSGGCNFDTDTGKCQSKHACAAQVLREDCIKEGCSWQNGKCDHCSQLTGQQDCTSTGCGWDGTKCVACGAVGSGSCAATTGCKSGAGGVCEAELPATPTPSTSPTISPPTLGPITPSPTGTPIAGQTPNPTVSPTTSPTDPPQGPTTSPVVSPCGQYTTPALCGKEGCGWSSTGGCIDCTTVGVYACVELGCASPETTHTGKCGTCHGQDAECQKSDGCSVLSDGTCVSRYECTAIVDRPACLGAGCGYDKAPNSGCLPCDAAFDADECSKSGCAWNDQGKCTACGELTDMGKCGGIDSCRVTVDGKSCTSSNAPPATEAPHASACSVQTSASHCAEVGCAWSSSAHMCIDCNNVASYACDALGCAQYKGKCTSCNSGDKTTCENSKGCVHRPDDKTTCENSKGCVHRPD
eukprot:Hpha_TRINITY_DN16167_c1_g4::TRINITY_DN16167_c1_g4_i3::g.5949::m.5949